MYIPRYRYLSLVAFVVNPLPDFGIADIINSAAIVGAPGGKIQDSSAN